MMMCITIVRGQQPVGGLGYFQQVAEAYPLNHCSVSGASRQPAALGVFDRPGALIRCRKFFFKESPPEILIAFVFPVSSGSFIATLDHFQLANFRQMQAGFGYGMKLAPGVTGGLKINFFKSAAGIYTSKPLFPVEIGVSYAINAAFTTGLTFCNIIPFTKNNSRPRLPAIITVTWAYSFSEYLSSVFQMAWMDRSGMIISPGFKLFLNEKMNFYFGYSSQVKSFNGTAGYRLKGFNLSLSVQWHSSLGMMNTVELGWSGKSQGKK